MFAEVVSQIQRERRMKVGNQVALWFEIVNNLIST